jgi:CheY-like chemotaxis protein
MMSAPSGPPAGGAGPTGEAAANVLIVDDRRANQLTLEAVLEPTGLRLFCASSGEEALRLALKYVFAVVLMDVNLPGGMDGIQTASLLKLRPAQQGALVILMSADVAPVGRFDTAILGGAEFVTKPFDPDALRAKVLAAAGRGEAG